MYAPNLLGIYYCGVLNPNGSLFPYYVGRAAGTNVSIKSRLSDHIRENDFPDATHFVYYVCATEAEAQQFEVGEIARLQPKYNKRVG